MAHIESGSNSLTPQPSPLPMGEGIRAVGAARLVDLPRDRAPACRSVLSGDTLSHRQRVGACPGLDPGVRGDSLG